MRNALYVAVTHAAQCLQRHPAPVGQVHSSKYYLVGGAAGAGRAPNTQHNSWGRVAGWTLGQEDGARRDGGEKTHPLTAKHTGPTPQSLAGR